MKNCCQDCFTDPIVRTFIGSKGRLGTCDWCGADSVALLRPYELNDLFQPWLVLYEQKPLSGPTLIECIENDGWKVFSDILNYEEVNSLLDAINYENPQEASWSAASQNWISLGTSFEEFNASEVWRGFADHIRYKRRFLPQAEKYEFLSEPKDWLPPLLESTKVFVNPGDKFFRARTDGEQNKKDGVIAPWPTSKMGALSKEKATRGRANPAGIPYLYAAYTPETAVAEVRPWVGQYVSIREVTPKSSLKLAKPGKVQFPKSPFGQKDLSETLEQWALVKCLDRELAKPVSPDSSEVEYVPTQYLAEVIRNAGYDGIIYQSSVDPGGVNVVLFEPEKLTVSEEGRLVRVTGMTMKMEDC